MLIPSIDLMDGRVVQLEQGERRVFATDDVDAWVRAFSSYPLVQVIDLDQAMNRGSNDAIVRSLCARLPCQVGGGVRTVARAQTLIEAGALRVIAGSALFTKQGVNVKAAEDLATAVGPDHFVAAVDCRAGRVVIDGWRTRLAIRPEDAVRALEPFASAFLCTIVDGEGLLGGIDMAAVTSVAQATSRRVIAAGGIRNPAEVDRLHALGIDAVVGMALYRTTAFAREDSGASNRG